MTRRSPREIERAVDDIFIDYVEDSRDRRAWLKDLGLLKNPESQQAGATVNLVSVLSEEGNGGD